MDGVDWEVSAVDSESEDGAIEFLSLEVGGVSADELREGEGLAGEVGRRAGRVVDGEGIGEIGGAVMILAEVGNHDGSGGKEEAEGGEMICAEAEVVDLWAMKEGVGQNGLKVSPEGRGG